MKATLLFLIVFLIALPASAQTVMTINGQPARVATDPNWQVFGHDVYVASVRIEVWPGVGISLPAIYPTVGVTVEHEGGGSLLVHVRPHQLIERVPAIAGTYQVGSYRIGIAP